MTGMWTRCGILNDRHTVGHIYKSIFGIVQHESLNKAHALCSYCEK